MTFDRSRPVVEDLARREAAGCGFVNIDAAHTDRGVRLIMTSVNADALPVIELLDNEFVLRSCVRDVGCSFYQGLQGTSMATPHVTGVAALVIGVLGGDADPPLVRQIIEESAADHACPVPATVDYTIVGRPESWNATCTGTPSFNNFYSHGLVDAAAADALAESHLP